MDLFACKANDTNLMMKRDFTRVSGESGVLSVCGIETSIYNLDGSLDSIVCGFLDRDLTVSGNDFIVCCSGIFYTEEAICD